MYTQIKYLGTNLNILLELSHYTNLTPQSTIFGVLEELHHEYNILINYILIYKYYLYKSRNSESLNFIGLKNIILKTITIEEKIAGNYLTKRSNLIKKC